MGFIRNIGTVELVIILLIVVFLFGGKKIPELVRGITNSMREFKKASKDEDESDEDE